MKYISLGLALIVGGLSSPALAEQKWIPDLCQYTSEPPIGACVRTSSAVVTPGKFSQEFSQSYAATSTSAYNVFEGKLYSTESSARASLATGQLGVAVSGNDLAYTDASATLRDVLTFNVKDFSLVSYKIAIHGFASTGQAGKVELGYNSIFSHDRYQYAAINQYYLTSMDGETTESSWGNDYGRHDSFKDPEIPDTYFITGSLYVDPEFPTFSYQATMASFVTGPGYARFGNTASITFELPEGASLTSQSGLFLTGAAAVPEPQSWALMLGGFGVVGFAARRRNKRMSAA